MKKIEINKELRVFLFFFAIALIGVSGFFINKELKKERITEEKEVVVTYKSSLDFKQEAKVKINKIYDSDTRGAGEICISKFVDKLENTFTLKYKGREGDTASGSYSLTAKITAMKKIGEEAFDVWHKDITIRDEKPFESVTPDENGVIFQKIEVIDKKQLAEVVKSIKEDDDVSDVIEIKLVTDVNIKSDDGEYDESHEIVLDIPGEGNYIIVQEPKEDLKSKEVDQIKNVEIPLNRKLISIMGILAGLGVIGLILLIFFTSTIVIDEREKLLNKIFKNHGDNMVALVEEDQKKLNGAIRVKDIKDLVRIGEELIRPILYKHDEDQNKIENFYIINKDEVYLYRVEVQETDSVDNEGDIEKHESINEVAVDSVGTKGDSDKNEKVSQNTAVLEKDDVIIID